MTSVERLEGRIVHVEAKTKKYVFIKHEMYPKGIYYLNKNNLELSKGCLVSFVINKEAHITAARPTAKDVYIVKQEKGNNNNNKNNNKEKNVTKSNKVKNNNASNEEWQEFTIVHIDDYDNFLIVKPIASTIEGLGNSLKVNKSLLPHHILQLKSEDVLGLIIERVEEGGGIQRTFFKVRRAKVVRFDPRPAYILESFVNDLRVKLTSPDTSDYILLQILPNKPLWTSIFTVSDNSKNYTLIVLDLMCIITRNCQQNHVRALRNVLEDYFVSNQFQFAWEPQNEKKIRELYIFITKNYKDFDSYSLQLFLQLMEPNAQEEQSQVLQPLLPNFEEFLKIRKNDNSLLTPFKTSYEDSNEYLRHFYHLMHQNGLCRLQTGLENFMIDKKNDLDNMQIFKGVQLKGIYLEENGVLHLIITLENKSKGPKWAKLPGFGSLVCLILDNQLIWALISDDNDNKKRLMSLELLSDYNELSITEIIMMLNNKNNSEILLAISPTLFASVGPALIALKEKKFDYFKLKQEIIGAKAINQRPEYVENLDKTKTFTTTTSTSVPVTNNVPSPKASLISRILGCFSNNKKSPNTQTTITTHTVTTNVMDEAIEKLKHTLDDSQYRALKNVFQRRLSIVQGPPGCGKTFLGVKIVELFLQHCSSGAEMGFWDTCEDFFGNLMSNQVSSLQEENRNGNHFNGKVLVLTYKNHALDEFVKQIKSVSCLHQNWKGKVVRIGGRSSEPEFDCINLNTILKEEQQNKSSSNLYLRTTFYHCREEVRKLRQELNLALNDVFKETCLSPDNLYNHLKNENMILDLLYNTPWHKLDIKYGPEAKVLSQKNIKVKLEKAKEMSCNNILAFLKGDFKSLSQEGVETRDFLLETLTAATMHWWPKNKPSNDTKNKSKNEIIERNIEENGLGSNGDDDNVYELEEDIDYLTETLDVFRSSDNNGGNGQQRQQRRFRTSDPFWIDNKKGAISTLSISDLKFEMGFQGISLLSKSQFDLSSSKLTGLSDVQKREFLLQIIKSIWEKHADKIEKLLERAKILQEQLKNINVERKYNAIKDRTVIAMTITGACINKSLVEKLNPTLVVVEEAAEVLEPALMAALTGQMQHLVLIGDHQQLKPLVESYELARHYHLDISMMERLILANYPFSQLQFQSRMMPEFAKLLRDIYPKYQTNMANVASFEPLQCLEKSMFVWSHDFHEDYRGQGQSGRSRANRKEADMAIALALFIWKHEPKVKPSQITILAAYLAQARLIQNRLESLKSTKDSFIASSANSEDSDEQQTFHVSTIDGYQGDENDYIIVSLVRSNEKGELGFLNMMNRRCVAQSRAKKGMYFVCNSATICKKQSSVWSPLISAMTEAHCVGKAIGVRIPKEPDMGLIKVESAHELMELVTRKVPLSLQPLEDFCNLKLYSKKVNILPESIYFQLKAHDEVLPDDLHKSIENEKLEKVEEFNEEREIMDLTSVSSNAMDRLELANKDGFQLVELKLSRSFDLSDEWARFRDLAWSVLYRFNGILGNQSSKTPSKIEYVYNKVLHDKFESMKIRLRIMGRPDTEILAFHGTSSQNLLSIAKNNLDLRHCNRFAYGRGFYLSEYPDISQGFGDGLLLFRVLPGREFEDSSNQEIPPHFDSKKLPGNDAEFGRMNVIPNPDQLLPFFIYHF